MNAVLWQGCRQAPSYFGRCRLLERDDVAGVVRRYGGRISRSREPVLPAVAARRGDGPARTSARRTRRRDHAPLRVAGAAAPRAQLLRARHLLGASTARAGACRRGRPREADQEIRERRAHHGGARRHPARARRGPGASRYGSSDQSGDGRGPPRRRRSGGPPATRGRDRRARVPPTPGSPSASTTCRARARRSSSRAAGTSATGHHLSRLRRLRRARLRTAGDVRRRAHRDRRERSVLDRHAHDPHRSATGARTMTRRPFLAGLLATGLLALGAGPAHAATLTISAPATVDSDTTIRVVAQGDAPAGSRVGGIASAGASCYDDPLADWYLTAADGSEQVAGPFSVAKMIGPFRPGPVRSACRFSRPGRMARRRSSPRRRSPWRSSRRRPSRPSSRSRRPGPTRPRSRTGAPRRTAADRSARSSRIGRAAPRSAPRPSREASAAASSSTSSAPPSTPGASAAMGAPGTCCRGPTGSAATSSTRPTSRSSPSRSASGATSGRGWAPGQRAGRARAAGRARRGRR